jgi:outer membrane immunogenic protein
VYNWTGFYIGGNVGYSWGRSRSDWNFFAANAITGSTTCTAPGDSGAFCATGSDSNRLNGAIGGLQAGYNWQTGNFLAGVETDIQISGQKGTSSFTTTFPTTIADIRGIVAIDHSEKLQWFGTLRGRAGVNFDRWLIYATAGLAYGGLKLEGAAAATGPPPGGGTCGDAGVCPFLPLGNWSNTRTKAGWTAGVGIEGAISDNWTVKLEYLHIDLGSVETTFATLPGGRGNATPTSGSFSAAAAGTGSIRTRVTDNIVRVGINYKFDWGKGPVVARY